MRLVVAVTRADQIAAFRALRQAVEDLEQACRDVRVGLDEEREPWKCHPDYPDRIAAEVDDSTRQVRQAAAEFARTLRSGP